MGYLKTDVDGNRVPLNEGGILKDVEVITGVQTLTVEESGKVFSLQAAAGVQIDLPAVATSAGVHYKFIVGLAFATTDWTILAATSVVEGSATVAGSVIAASNENTISFVASAESVGDWAEIVCDGTSWLVSGQATASGGITFTDA